MNHRLTISRLAAPCRFSTMLVRHLASPVFLLSILLAATFTGCHPQAGGEEDDEGAGQPVDVRTPVTVTQVTNGPLEDYIELNAVSTFLQHAFVKATANGYLQTNDIYPGKYVEAGQTLFTLKTKEAQTLGNSLKILDSTLHFSGIIRINAGQRGYITQLNHQAGDYVQDGEQLAVISDRNSFVFLLNLPYEQRRTVLGLRNVQLILPDGKQLTGTVGPVMPTVDSVSQTQNVIIRVSTDQQIPENLIAKVRIPKTAAAGNTQSLPKGAILTDETESEYWVMKMINDSVAVKTTVKRGLETADRVQIDSPLFSPGDRILLTGNYGLPDTAKVTVEKKSAE